MAGQSASEVSRRIETLGLVLVETLAVEDHQHARPCWMTALLAAKMLNLQTSGIYHTDFPQYIRILTEDSFLESVAWRYMHWFYGQLDTVFVNSEEIPAELDQTRLRTSKIENFTARPRHRTVSSCSTRLNLLRKIRRV